MQCNPLRSNAYNAFGQHHATPKQYPTARRALTSARAAPTQHRGSLPQRRQCSATRIQKSVCSARVQLMLSR
eukprot:7089167-Lingulodinium_polyedra.AAC.1